jgi:hypothetical protein
VKVGNSSHDGDCEIQVMVEIVGYDLYFTSQILCAGFDKWSSHVKP